MNSNRTTALSAAAIQLCQARVEEEEDWIPPSPSPSPACTETEGGKEEEESKSHYWFKSYSIFSEWDKVVKLGGGGSVINRAYPV